MQLRRGVVLAVALAACGQRRGDDCALVQSDPLHALAEMAARYPHDPVQRASVIERCLAPDGDDCERLARIVAAIPAMAPELAAAPADPGGERSLDEPAAPRAPRDVRAICRGMPAEMQRCLLPSYVLGHVAECRTMRAQLAKAAPGLAAATRSPPRRCEASAVAVSLTPDGAWLGTGADARCFAPRRRRALDIAWLEAELRPLAALACPPTVELAAAAGVRYQDIVAAMDAAAKVGLVDTALTTPRELSVSFAMADADRAAAHCPATVVTRAGAASSSGAASTPDGRVGRPDQAALAAAPVVIVTRAELTVGGTSIGSMAELARGNGPVDPLRQALPPHPQDPTIILQADQATDMAVITRVIETAHAAGYSNLLFAVKTRQPR